MVRVEFLGPIDKKPMEMEINSLSELKEQLKKDEDLEKWLESCAIAVNDKIVTSIETDLKDGDKVLILPPVCGG